MKKVIFEMDMSELSAVESPVEYKTELGIFYDYNKAEDVKSAVDEIKKNFILIVFFEDISVSINERQKKAKTNRASLPIFFQTIAYQEYQDIVL